MASIERYFFSASKRDPRLRKPVRKAQPGVVCCAIMLQHRSPCTSWDGVLSFCIAVTHSDPPLSPMGGQKRKEVDMTVNQPVTVLEKKVVLNFSNLLLKKACVILLLILEVKMYAVLYKKKKKNNAGASLALCLLGSRGLPFPVFLFCYTEIRSARS